MIGAKRVIILAIAICLMTVLITGCGCSVSYALLTHPVPGDCGSIIPSPLPGANNMYKAGIIVTLEARPTTGYSFSRWSGDASGTQNPIVITMDYHKNINAEFIKAPSSATVIPPTATTPTTTAKPAPTPSPIIATPIYTLTTSCIGSGSGSVSPSGGSYKQGSQVIITATPGAGSQFERWSGTDDNSSNPSIVTMNSDRSVTAYFKSPPPTTTVPPTTTTVAPPPATVTLPPVTTVIPPPVTVTVPTTTVVPPVSLSVAVNPPGSGAVNPGSGVFNAGSSVTLIASPAACYKFDYWSGDTSGTSSSTGITMNSNKTVTANFSKIRYTLTTSVTGSGNISPNGGTYDCGETVTLSATLTAGYAFDHWSGTNNDSINPTSATMNSDKNIIAYFKALNQSEDFTTYTKLDPESKLTVNSNTVTFSEANFRGSDIYVYRDKGENYFSGNFEHIFTVNISSYDTYAIPNVWMLANSIDDRTGIAGKGDYLSLNFYRGDDNIFILQFREYADSTIYEARWAEAQIGTTYYIKVQRDESIGTYGRLYCYIYSDPGRTNLLNTLQLDLHKKVDFRYIYALNTVSSGETHRASGFIKDLYLR